MNEQDDYGPGKQGPFGDLAFRLVAVAALGLGSISGLTTISSTDDRYRAADAARDLQIRDERIVAIRDRIDAVERDIERIDRSGPATGNAEVSARVRELAARIEALERHGRP